MQNEIPSEVSRFIAIDFETANPLRNSACAIGIIRVEKNKIVEKVNYLIQPPQQYFQFSYIHGITWSDVAKEPNFSQLWPRFSNMFKNIDFIAAHNASFDSSVLSACLSHYKIPEVNIPFLCTVNLSRKCWKIFPTKLPDVCRFLNIELNHHDAMSDAMACAKIVLASFQTTVQTPFPPALNNSRKKSGAEERHQSQGNTHVRTR